MQKVKRVDKLMRSTIIIGGAAIISFFAVVFILDVSGFGISLASFAATLFMILNRPNHEQLTNRRIFAAYALAGYSAFIAMQWGLSQTYTTGLSIVLAVLMMTFFRAQHAPAIGMTISFAINSLDFWKILGVILTLLLIIHVVRTALNMMKHPGQYFVESKHKIDFDF